MAVGGGPENNLKQNEDAESGHGREQGIPLDVEFSVEPLLAEPEKSEENGASLENVNRPGLHCTKGERTEHQKAERCVKQDCSNLSRSLLAADPRRLSCVKRHRVRYFLRQLVRYDGFLVRCKSSIQSLPRMGLRSGSRRTCSTTSLQSEPVVNSPSTAFQNPESFSSSLS